MKLTDKFAQFMSDESGHADSRKLVRFAGITAGTTLAALMMMTSSEAEWCGTAGECTGVSTCSSSWVNGHMSYACV